MGFETSGPSKRKPRPLGLRLGFRFGGDAYVIQIGSLLFVRLRELSLGAALGLGSLLFEPLHFFLAFLERDSGHGPSFKRSAP
jgi:hypothetical protein